MEETYKDRQSYWEGKVSKYRAQSGYNEPRMHQSQVTNPSHYQRPANAQHQYKQEVNVPTPIKIDFKSGAYVCDLNWSAPQVSRDTHFTYKLIIHSGDVKSLELPSYKCSHRLETTPGEWYTVDVQAVIEESYKSNILGLGKIQFKAVFNRDEMTSLYRMAVDNFGYKLKENMRQFSVFYRCKSKDYFDDVTYNKKGLMEKYVKDNNGQAASLINGVIRGLFWSTGLEPSVPLPPQSPFGPVRLTVAAGKLYDPTVHELYFGDFYCNSTVHYVTVVVCVRGSETDRHCRKHLIALNPASNPFLQCIKRPWCQSEYWTNKNVLVELYFTENVPTSWGTFEQIVSPSIVVPHRSVVLTHNRSCPKCNLQPLVDRSTTCNMTIKTFPDKHDQNRSDPTTLLEDEYEKLAQGRSSPSPPFEPVRPVWSRNPELQSAQCPDVLTANNDNHHDDIGPSIPLVRPAVINVSNEKIDLGQLFRESDEKGIRGRYVRTLGKLDESVPADTCLCMPLGCCWDKDTNEFIVCDTKHHLVKIFSESGEQRGIIPSIKTRQKLSQPSAVLPFNSEQLLIKDNHGLFLFTRDGDFVRTVTRLNRPIGLALDSHHRALTLAEANTGQTALIKIYDVESSEPLDTFPLNPFEPSRWSSQPRFLDVAKDKLAVTDLGLQRVYTISLKNGLTLHSFGDNGHAPGQFSFVSGIQIDGAGNYLIGDAKGNRVQLFDPDGNFVCVIELDEPGAPYVSDICLTDDGHLMVSLRRRHAVVVYKLEPKSD